MLKLVFIFASLFVLATAPSPFSRASKLNTSSNSGVSSYGPFGPFGNFPFPADFPFNSPAPATTGGGIKVNNRNGIFDVVYEWNVLDFAFPSQQHREAAIQSGAFIPENNVPLGIDRWRNKLFVTTPRWKLGTPATLSTISLMNDYKSPLLVPYPSLDWHTPTDNPDCSKLASVYRTFVDTCNRLWVIDAGVVETLTNFRQLCPAKIVIFDLTRDIHIFSYVIPKDQLKQDALHANIVVDVPNNQCDNAFAYVTDVWRFGVVVFSFYEGKSWRTTSHLHYPNPLASDYNFQGLNFQWLDGTFGLSLSPLMDTINGDRVMFFHPMSSFNEFMVSTGVLKNESNWLNPFNGPPASVFQPIGSRGPRGQSATVGISRNGIQFFSLVQRSGVGCWDIRKPYSVNNLAIVESDAVKMNFPNDLKVDHEPSQNIWIITNYLPQFLYSTLDFNRVNFRIMAAPVDRAVAGTVCDPNVAASLVKDPIDYCAN